MTQLTARDTLFYKDHVAIFLKKRKNDQYQKESWVYIASFDSNDCPVALVRKFLRIGKHKDSSALRRQKLSHGGTLELVKYQLRQISLDPTKCTGVHTFKVRRSQFGSCHWCARSSNHVPSEGGGGGGRGWQSESSKNRYIKKVKNSLLAVSKTFQFSVQNLYLLWFSGL